MGKLNKEWDYKDPNNIKAELNIHGFKDKKIIYLDEYKSIKDSIILDKESDKTFINDNDNSSKDFILEKNEDDLISLLTEHLVKIGCKEVTQQKMTFLEKEFDRPIILFSAIYKTNNKRKITSLTKSIFNKFSLWEHGILLEIHQG